MILVPNLETVVILTPRTGTRAIKRAIKQRHPDAIHLYRHMEADGVPQGYDRWRKVGIVREPVARLWSLYKYLQRFGLDYCREHNPVYTSLMRASVDRPFEDWLLNNQVPFTTPYDSSGRGSFYPAYTVRHPLPENRKSQYLYLRPDLGTIVFPYENVGELHGLLDIAPPVINGTDVNPPPDLSDDAREYVENWFAWDLAVSRYPF